MWPVFPAGNEGDTGLLERIPADAPQPSPRSAWASHRLGQLLQRLQESHYTISWSNFCPKHGPVLGVKRAISSGVHSPSIGIGIRVLQPQVRHVICTLAAIPCGSSPGSNAVRIESGSSGLHQICMAWCVTAWGSTTRITNSVLTGIR